MSEKLFKCKVIESGFVAGKHFEAGETLNLTERQRNTGLRRGRIEEVQEAPAPQPAKKQPAKKAAKKQGKKKS